MRILFTLLSLITGLLLAAETVRAAGVRPDLPKPYLVAPIFLDGRPLEEAWVFPRDKDSEFAIEAAPLINALEGPMKEELLKNLKALIATNKTISLKNLNAAGVSAQFDEQSLELRLALPLKYRRTQSLDLTATPGSAQKKYLRPQQQSGYLNLRLSQGYQYGQDSTGSSNDKKLPFSGHTDLVENIHGLVFETAADYDEYADSPWKRQDTRFRIDDEENRNRYTLGDLTLTSQGFQLVPAMAGLSIVREFGIQPYRTLRPLSNTEILIKRNSMVEIWVNGFLYSQMRLAPGVFNIREFPLALGQNNVKVKIKDDLGQEETFDFSALFENSILAQGENEFSYSSGFPWRPSSSDRAYAQNALTSLFHRVGVTDQLTLGANFQNYLSQNLTGLEISGITNGGYFSLDGAYANQNNITKGYAERLRYRSLEQMGGFDLPFTGILEIENHDPQFQYLSADPISPLQYLRRYDAQINFRPWSFWTFGFGGGYLDRATDPDQRFYRANLILPFKFNCRLEVSYTKTVADQTDDRVFVSFFWNEPAGRYSASSYYDSGAKSVNAQVSRNNINKYDDYRATASIQNAGNTNTENLTAEYFAQPASVRLDHYSTQTAGQNFNTTSLGLNTGFAWVGGHGAFTQPIADSFTLIEAKNLPPGQVLKINPNSNGSEAQLGPRSATVLKDETSYYKYLVNLDTTSLPVGYLLEKEYYQVLPTYHSGILIPLDFHRKMIVRGRLVKTNGQVLAFAAGDVVNAQGQLVDNTFFTNKEGHFLIEGLEPGNYRVMTDRADLSEIPLTVPDNSDNQVDLGNISIPSGDTQ